MQIIDYTNEFHVIIPFNNFFRRNVEAVKAIEGKRWHPEKKIWILPGTKRQEVEQLKFTHRAEIIVPDNLRPETVGEVPPLPELSVTIPWREGVEPRPYQNNGVARAIELGRVLNGDEQGLGKTMQSIGSILGIETTGKQPFPCIVICPASTKLNWKREWEKFSNKKAMVLDSDMSAASKKNWHQYVISGLADVVIINYESINTFMIESFPQEKTRTGKRKPWHSRDVVLKPFMAMFKSGILDESHRCKDDSTNQSKFILRIFSSLEFRILLSGTPIVNKPKDLYPQLAILGHLPTFGGKKGYLNRYCEGGTGANNLKELNYLLNKHCFFRREKKDVAKDLPDKFRQTIICDIATRRDYDRAVNDLATWLRDQGMDEGQIDKRLRGEALTKIGALKQISARGKLNEVKEFTQEVLDAGRKADCVLQSI
jgi:SWI/SNF-related matrix-associated actin-dependent regulator 1 of chromatin subfamily A